MNQQPNPTPLVTKRETVLQNAIKHVTKDRNVTHGNPEDNFTTIANYWNNYLRSIGAFTSTDILSGKDVAVMMILMKVSRLSTSPAIADHWEDIAGYSACGGGIAISD